MPSSAPHTAPDPQDVACHPGTLPKRAALYMQDSLPPGLMSHALCASGLVSDPGHAGRHRQEGSLGEFWVSGAAPARRGHCYRKAMDLARQESPGDVVLLEEQWGDWLMSQHQVGLAAELSCSISWPVSGEQIHKFGSCFYSGDNLLLCCLSGALEGMQCWLQALYVS